MSVNLRAWPLLQTHSPTHLGFSAMSPNMPSSSAAPKPASVCPFHSSALTTSLLDECPRRCPALPLSLFLSARTLHLSSFKHLAHCIALRFITTHSASASPHLITPPPPPSHTPTASLPRTQPAIAQLHLVIRFASRQVARHAAEQTLHARPKPPRLSRRLGRRRGPRQLRSTASPERRAAYIS